MEESRRKLKNRNIAIVIIFLILSLLLFLFFLHRSYQKEKTIRVLKIRQKAQFKTISFAMNIFQDEYGDYPPSEALDPNGQPYCGAMKLSEAMMGPDLLGFHPDSVFRADGMDATSTKQVYPIPPSTDNLKVRLGPLQQYDTANPNRLLDIYGSGNTGPFNENHFVLCDVYPKKRPSGRKTGMPILYYKANISNTEHDVNNPNNPENIYNYKDNQALLSLGVPWKPNVQHPLFINPKIFYAMTKDREVFTRSEPYRKDSYILISAGFDGLYGTADDICNFEWKRSVIENLDKTEN